MSSVGDDVRAKIHDLFEKEIEKIRLEAFPPVDGRILMRVPPRGGKSFAFNVENAKHVRKDPTVQRVVNAPPNPEPNMWSEFMLHVSTTFNRRQYAAEREHPEWVDLGGES